ncbi:papilin-like [Melanotaenia boesemani]|uniref:papilin-like n=1 Tax=Melanotaenia boesemani TaxID=1250792 RepID=UPI001C04B6AA|nr:papilin-like [Melanotaenia boesemani]
MKMKNLLFAFLFGFLATAHSTPLNTVTQIQAHPNEDLKEVEMEELIIDYVRLSSLTTESPKRNTTVHASQRPSFDSPPEGSGETSWLPESSSGESTTTAQSILKSTFEGSGETSWLPESSSGDSTTTTQSILESTSEGSGETSWLPESSSGDSTTTTQSILESTSEGSGETSWLPESSSGDSTTTTQSILESTSEGSGETSWLPESSSGDSTTTTQSILESTSEESGTTTASSVGSDSSTVHSLQSGFSSSTMANEAGTEVDVNYVNRLYLKNAGEEAIEKTSNQGLRGEVWKVGNPGNPTSNKDNKDKTADWIIILGFFVGLAALVLLCVAIATRDKWYGPKRVFNDETTSNASNQTRELEKQTFLQKEEPKVNGKEAEYTVIPLDDLPGNFPSD